MKSIILIAAFAVVSVAASSGLKGYGQRPVYNSLKSDLIESRPVSSIDQDGQSNQFREQDAYGNTNFGYDESHATGGSSRREQIQKGVTRGSYSLSVADGRRRTVHYVADHDGFRAVIETNEQGVEAKSPADVLINQASSESNGLRTNLLAAPVTIARQQPISFSPMPVYQQQAPVLSRQAAPVSTIIHQAPLSVPESLSIPSSPVLQNTGYSQQWDQTRVHSNQLDSQIALENPTPLAFNYNFGVNHLASRSIEHSLPLRSSFGSGFGSVATGPINTQYSQQTLSY